MKTYPTLFYHKRDLEVFFFFHYFSSFQYRDVMDGSHIFCLVWVCMESGVRFREADTCMLYPLVFNCKGGGWYVMCAKSVAVTWLCTLF